MTMARSDKGHRNEVLNLRSFYLRLIKKIWVIPAAAAIGALLGLLIYTAATVLPGAGQRFSSQSMLYIKFAYDEKAGTMVDHYNAYTWNLLMSDENIIAPLEADLATKGTDIGRDAILSSLTAEIPSDVRVLMLTVTTGEKELTDSIMDSAVKALVNYGKINDAFDSITLLSQGDASLVVYTDRSAAAAIFGAVLAAVCAVLILLLLDALDDAVYVPEDAERRYGISVLGTVFKGADSRDDSFFTEEMAANYDKLIAGAGEVMFISVDSIGSDEQSKADLEAFKKTLGKAVAESSTRLEPMAVPGSMLDNYRKIGTADGVILAVPAGLFKASFTDHLIAQLKKHECPILGLVLVRADEKFIKRYYGLK